MSTSTSTPNGNQSIALEQADVPEVVVDLLESQQQLIDEQAETIDDLEDRVSELEDYREENAPKRAEDRQRITDVEDTVEDIEDDLEDGNGVGSDGENTTSRPSSKPQTPLEQTVGLPQEMIQDETANVRRAVFVASDVSDYTKKVPAGYSMKSSDLRKILKAGSDCRGHSQTVQRVMNVLDDLGGDGVEIVDRRGQKRVIFDEDLVGRLERLGGSQDVESSGHDVVRHQEA